MDIVEHIAEALWEAVRKEMPFLPGWKTLRVSRNSMEQIDAAYYRARAQEIAEPILKEREFLRASLGQMWLERHGLLEEQLAAARGE